MHYPYPWVPKIVPLQVLRVGQLFILAVPAEFTTMSGRYLTNAIKQVTKFVFHSNSNINDILYCITMLVDTV